MPLLGRNKPAVAQIIAPNDYEASSLTAAGKRISRRESAKVRMLLQPWQAQSLAYYDKIGEIKYAAQFYSRGLAPLRLYAAQKDENGEWEPIEDKNHPAVRQLERIQDPGGGRSGLLSSYGRLMFLIGEGVLFCSKNPETDLEQWEVLSPDELRVMDGGRYQRYRAPALGVEEYADVSDDDWKPVGDTQAVAYRLWRRHPRFSDLADSTMQGVLDLCEELILLTQSVRARARSRLAGAGILIIDGRITLPPAAPGTDEDPNSDPFMKALINAMTAPIQNENSPSALVPLTLRVEVPVGMNVKDMVAHVQLVDPMQLYPETGLRTECIHRIAIGLDMPPEVLEGLGQSNHWSAWQIDEQTWKAHLMPVAEQLVDDLTSSFLLPTLRDEGLADWDTYGVRYDAAEIINHPDRTRDAKDLHRDGVIGDKALRDAAGFADGDAPTKEELDRWLGVALKDSSIALYGIPSLRQGATLETSPGEVEVPPAPATDGGSADVTKAPPEKPETPESLVGSNGHGAARIMGAADLGLLRAREVAGARLRSLARRTPETQAKLESGDRIVVGQIPSLLGRDAVRDLGETEARLVLGARDVILEAFRMFGVPDDVGAKLAEHVLEHAARTLYEPHPRPLPPAFRNYVAGLTVPLTLA